MAFPQVQSQLTQNYSGTTVDGASIDMPASVTSGNLLLVFLCTDGGASWTTPSGWTAVYQEDNGARFASSCFARLADGSEGGTSVFFDHQFPSSDGDHDSYTAQVYEISDWSGTAGDVEFSYSGYDLTSTPDCPSLTYSGGAQDILWIAATHNQNDDATVDSAPANYTNLSSVISGGGTNNGNSIGTAYRELNTGTEDPGAFSLSESEGCGRFTLAIPPGTSGGGATGGVSVDIAAGTLSLSGQSLQAQGGQALSVGAGSLTFTGQSQAVAAGASSDVQPGTLTLTGVALAVQSGVSATIGAGTLSLTGQSMSVTTGTSQAVSVDIAPGTLSLSPASLAAQHGQSLDMGAGSLSLSGLAAQISAGASVDVQAGTLSITGQELETAQGVSIDVQAGSITLSGQGIAETYGHSLEIGAGTLTLTGQSLSVMVVQVATPDGRTLTIPLDARTVTISADKRKVTIPDEVRSLKIH